MKIIVIGAGAAGLAVGWRLVQAGAEVVVLERGQPGRGATWAAAGMITVIGEDAGQNPAELAFSRRAGALWPDFAAEIEDTSGRKIGFRIDGRLAIAESHAEWERLSHIAQTAAAAGSEVSMIPAAEARAMEPLLHDSIAGALWDPAEAQVDNRELGIALAAAFLNAGGSLLLTEAVVRLETDGSRVRGARTPFALHEADAFVLAAGAWTGQIEGLPREIVPPVIPVKGEMIALMPPAGASLPHRIVGVHDAYLVPRHDRLFVGATVAREGFDLSLTDEAANVLRAGAERLMPALAGWEIVEHWAGLRPGSPDDLPILGPTDIANLFVASGQYRNGILFTPALAEAACNMILQRNAEPALAAFDPRRFARSAATG